MTSTVLVREAIEFEARGLFSKARERWAEAKEAASREEKSAKVIEALEVRRDTSAKAEGQAKAEAKRRRRRARSAGLSPGMRLQHVRRGRVLAEAVYRGEADIVFNGVSYPSMSAAARAAGSVLGMRVTNGRGWGCIDGWGFWGVSGKEDELKAA